MAPPAGPDCCRYICCFLNSSIFILKNCNASAYNSCNLAYKGNNSGMSGGADNTKGTSISKLVVVVVVAAVVATTHDTFHICNSK